jgi:L-ascorbate metabolism protein UlaG (beta-lactamase superfamily)
VSVATSAPDTASLAQLRALRLARGQIALWWLGQAGFAVRIADLLVLLDPFLSPRAERQVPPPFPAAAAGAVDAVLCSHEHWDHLDAPALAAIAHASPGARFVVPAPLVGEVAALGIAPGRILGARTEHPLRLGALTIRPLPACHGVDMGDAYGFGDGRFLGYVLDDGAVRAYHGGDTLVFAGLAELLRSLEVHLVLLPINGRDHFRETAAGIVGNMDHREAARLAADARVDLLIPMHYDMFAANRGYPSHLIDVAQRDHPGLAIAVPSRERIFVYTAPPR